MRPLPEFDFDEKYKCELNLRDYFGDHRKTLDVLLKKMDREKNALMFRNQLFATLQLYYDGMLSNDTDEGSICSQEEVLDQLLLAGETFVDNFYRGEVIDFDEILDMIMPYETEILKWGYKGSAKQRHLNGELHILKLQSFGFNIPEIVDMVNPDTLVCIASGGFEPAIIAKNITDNKTLAILKYSRIYERNEEVRIPSETPNDCLHKKIEGKRVLVIDDLIVSGKTIYKVLNYLSEMEPETLHATTSMFIPKRDTIFSIINPNPEFKVIKSYPFSFQYKKGA